MRRWWGKIFKNPNTRTGNCQFGDSKFSRKIFLFFFNKITGVELRIIITVPYGKVKKEKKKIGQIGGKKDGLNGNQFPRGRSRNVASPTERKNKRSVALATGFKRGRSIPPLTESVVADTSSPKRGNKLE